MQTDKGLYEWAQAHQNDTEGVNILPLKTSNADVEMPVGSSAMPPANVNYRHYFQE